MIHGWLCRWLGMFLAEYQTHSAAITVLPCGVIHDLLNEMDSKPTWTYVFQIP